MLIAFSIVVAIQILYFLIFFHRLADHKPEQEASQNLPPISIVICAHDELGSLKKNLPAILEQQYPLYEVIVVNDNSDDDSEMMLTRMESEFPNLVVRHISNQSKTLRGKKYPLTIGIRAAKYDHLLLTDADCAPSSDHWIRDMATLFSNEKEIILGYAPYRKRNGFLNKFIRYEAFFTALQYFSYSLAKLSYMGVGRNLAYKKQIFFDHNIYPKYPQLMSGDDDLLINAAADKKNTAIQINTSSFMYSEAKLSWDEYWHQKRRHVSTGKYYKLKHRFFLGLFSLSHLLFYVLFIITLIYSALWLEGLFLFAIRLIIQGIVMRTTMKKLVEDDLFFYYPMLDFFFLIYYLKLLPDTFQTKNNTWK
ncbi:MAG: glycosyltransferase [Chitinophagales bacterium]|nr:glycosyltransferase [Chitinophagales bacterium]